MTRKGDRALVYGVHRGVDKAFQIRRSGVAVDDGLIFCSHRHGRVIDGDDRRLNEHIRDGEQRPLHPRRQAYTHDFEKRLPFQAQRAEGKGGHILVLLQLDKHPHKGKRVCRRRSQRHAFYGHSHNEHEKQVEYNVRNPCHRKRDKGSFCVPFCTEDGAKVVGQRQERHTQKIDMRIGDGKLQKVARIPHGGQYRARDRKPDCAAKHPEDERHNQRRMHGVLRLRFIVCADGSCHDDVRADGKADEQVDHQMDKRRSRPDRANGVFFGRQAHHHHIGGVIEHL